MAPSRGVSSRQRKPLHQMPNQVRAACASACRRRSLLGERRVSMKAVLWQKYTDVPSLGGSAGACAEVKRWFQQLTITALRGFSVGVPHRPVRDTAFPLVPRGGRTSFTSRGQMCCHCPCVPAQSHSAFPPVSFTLVLSLQRRKTCLLSIQH